MKTNTKVFIASVVVGIVQVVYILSLPENTGEGFGDIAQGIGIIFSIILISIIFGILGFVFSKEKKFLQAFSWLGISFAVLLVINIALGHWRQSEFRKKYPEAPALMPLPANSPERKILLPTAQ